MGAFRDVVHDDDRVVEDWDTGEWVDVGPDGRWHPSASDRTRALLVLGAIVGVLLLLGAVLSVGGGDEDDDDEAAPATSSTTEPSGSSTTALPDPTSVDGEPPPEECIFDDRSGAGLRDPGVIGVLVLNGTPVGGRAGALSDELEAKGYATEEPGNADVQQATVVQYRPGYCAEARRLLDELAIAGAGFEPLTPDDDVFLGTTHVLVTLGRDSL